MKIFSLLLLVIMVSIAGYAQEKQYIQENKSIMKEKQNQRNKLFNPPPQFSIPGPDGLVFTDSIRLLPAPSHRRSLPGKYEFAQLTMPVAKPGTAFSSNMPVIVPDSSVHYFILNKKIRMINPMEGAKE